MRARTGILFSLAASFPLAICGCGSPARDAFDQAERYRLAGDHERSLYFYSEALQYEPSWSAAYAGRGSTQLELGAFAEAVADFDRAIESGSDDPGLLVSRGDAQLQLANYQQAEADYGRALAIAPESINALLRRARCRLRQGRYPKAAEDYSRALKGEPTGDERLRALFGRGRSLYEMAEYQQAAEDLTAVLGIDQSHARAHWYRALAYDALAQGLREDDPAGAARMSELAGSDRAKAVELDPSLDLSNDTLGRGLVNELRRVSESEDDDAPVTLDTGLPE